MKYQYIEANDDWCIWEVSANHKRERCIGSNVGVVEESHAAWQKYRPCSGKAVRWITKEEAFLKIL